MGKRLIGILALALIVGLTFSAAYAEVQNVRVSGDLNILAVGRNQFDLTDGNKENKNDDSESYFATQMRLRVDADLTDNIMVTLRLINERNWSAEEVQTTDIDLDLAYVTLKEFLYSPLSLTLGRQELKYGNQLVLGSAGTAAVGVRNGLSTDLSSRHAFDAIKATLNYDPLVVDIFYAKIDSGSLTGEIRGEENDDIDLYGVYSSFDIKKNLTADVYALFKNDSSDDKNDKIYTLGTLLQAAPLEDLKTSVEAAVQIGKMRRVAATSTDTRLAYAVQVKGDYTLSKLKVAPVLGIGYTLLSGDKRENNGKSAWDQMFYNQSLNNIAYAILPFTNLSVLNLKGSVKPMEDVAICLNYGWYRRARANTNSITSPAVDGDGDDYNTTYLMSGKKDLGHAVDLTVTYDYTEDVQLGLTAGWFAPGKAFAEGNRQDATQLIGSMKVAF